MKTIFEFIFICLYSIPQKSKSEEEKKEIMHGYLWIMCNILVFSLTAIALGCFRLRMGGVLWGAFFLSILVGWFGIGYLLLRRNVFNYLITENMYKHHSQMYYRMFGILVWILMISMIEVSYMFMDYRLNGAVHF